MKKIETSPVQLWKHIVITLNIKRPEDKRKNMLLFSTPLKFSLSLIKVFGKEIKFQTRAQKKHAHACIQTVDKNNRNIQCKTRATVEKNAWAKEMGKNAFYFFPL